MIVECIERFWDGNRCILYYPGDKADIDPLSPVAKYFDGWPPGTEVYTKSKGVSGTKIIPGKAKEPEFNIQEKENETKRSPGRPRKE